MANCTARNKRSVQFDLWHALGIPVVFPWHPLGIRFVYSWNCAGIPVAIAPGPQRGNRSGIARKMLLEKLQSCFENLIATALKSLQPPLLVVCGRAVYEDGPWIRCWVTLGIQNHLHHDVCQQCAMTVRDSLTFLRCTNLMATLRYKRFNR